MNTADRRIARATAVTLLALLAGCASPSHDESAFNAEPGSRMLTVAYRNIYDKYVDPVAMGPMAESALRRLDAIDSDITITRTADTIRISERGEVAASLPAPTDSDPDGWAQTTTKLVVAAEDHSRALAVANAEEVYSELMRGAIQRLDPLSRYADARAARQQRAAREGYGGIGTQISVGSHGVVIASVLPDTPAARAALRAGDIIQRIDGEDVHQLDETAVLQHLRGRVGTSVKLSLIPIGASGPTEVTLTRTLIVPETVRLDMIGDAALLRITSFNQGTAQALGQLVAEARKRANGHLSGIILDLRGNPGGLLDQAVAVADVFLSSGRIVSTRGRHPDSFQLFDATGTDMTGGAPLVLLIDGGSASSSEVVAAALQDRGRAVLIGSNSYGKGTVQNVIRLPNDGEMALTWSHLYAPSGYTFNGLGILPNVCTSAAEEDGKTVLARINRGEITDALRMAAWRSAGSLDDGQRADLARTCPKVRGDRIVDLDVARGLIADPKLYARALGLTEPDRGPQTTH
jgi:carboxyl-terminal processing protease